MLSDPVVEVNGTLYSLDIICGSDYKVDTKLHIKTLSCRFYVHKDVEVRGIEKIHHEGTLWRRKRESYWIFTLRTLSPVGLNLDE